MGSHALVDLCHFGRIDDVVDDLDFKLRITMLKTSMLKNCWWEREMALGLIEWFRRIMPSLEVIGIGLKTLSFQVMHSGRLLCNT